MRKLLASCFPAGMAGRSEREVYQRITAWAVCVCQCAIPASGGQADNIDAMKPVLYDIIRGTSRKSKKKHKSTKVLLFAKAVVNYPSRYDMDG